MIFWKLLLGIICAFVITTGIIGIVDSIVLHTHDKQNLKLKAIYYCLIGIGIGMLVGGIML